MLLARFPLFFQGNAAVRYRPDEFYDEARCAYLLHHLVRMQGKYEQINGLSDSHVVSKNFAHFERLLITGTRTQAIAAGEGFYAQGKMLLANPSASESDILNNECVYDFKSAYQEWLYKIDQILNLTLTKESAPQIRKHIFIFAESKSFGILRLLLDKMPDKSIAQLMSALEKVLYTAIRFGNEEMVCYLLERGVSPHKIDTGNHDGKYRPLILILDDMNRCVLKIEELIKDAKSANCVFGDENHLRVLLEHRLLAYREMIEALLKHGAQADNVHDEDCIHEHTPREAAQYHLNVRIPMMKIQNFCLADAVVRISEVVGMIANAPVHKAMNENDAGCVTESATKRRC